MLQSVNDLKGYAIVATDGLIGNIEEFYFDDMNLIVRNIVINTGNWLTGKQNLISPFAATHLDRERREIRVSLTKEQVQKSPGVDKHKPVSRQIEKIVSDYYGNRYYWDERPDFTPTQLAEANKTSEMIKSNIETGVAATPAPDVHLRSMQEIASYQILAKDGEIGQVEDFFIETDTWAICYIGVNTSNWLPGKHVLIASGWIGQINWAHRTVNIHLNREQIEKSPDYDKVTEISREYETRLNEHYNFQTKDENKIR